MDGQERDPLGEPGERPGSAQSSRRVSSGGRGVSRLLVVTLVIALVVAGLMLARGGSDEPAPGAPTDDDRSEVSGPGELSVVERSDVSATYASAAVGLGRAHTFGYVGTVRSAGPSLLRPGPATGDTTMSVTGAVHLPLSISTEVAVGESGEAVETVISGPLVVARRASTVDGLAGASWSRVPQPHDMLDPRRVPSPPRLGLALVANALQAGGDRRDDPADADGRQVIRATVPDRRGGVGLGPGSSSDELASLLSGAELVVTLGEAGDVARIELTSAPEAPGLRVLLDIVRVGDPTLVSAGDLDGPLTAAVPADVLTEVGLGSIALTGLPEGWALTAADGRRPGGTPEVPVAACGGPEVSFTHTDLGATALSDRFLSVTAWRDACADAFGPRVGTGPNAWAPFTAGRFQGVVGHTGAEPSPYRGDVSDGTTRLTFSTDLQPEAAAVALASLAPTG